MRRALCVLVGLGLLGPAGCDDGGGNETRDVVIDAGGGGAGGAGGGGGDVVSDYCRGIGTAKCSYVFRCVQGGSRSTIFGLDGPELDDCVGTEAQRCEEDARDRAARGTLREITAEEIQICQDRMEALDCPPGQPGDWVTMFYQFYAQRCTSVGLGNVPQGGDCERRTDCQDRDQICIDGACGPAQPVHVMEDCDAESNLPGVVNADASCPGEVCAQVGPNDDDKAGICTIDCTEGFGCPSGAACLQARSLAGPPSWYCTWPCAADRDCQNGFECVPINPDEIGSALHCAAAPAAED